MSVIRDTYHSFRFPITNTRPEHLLDLYRVEFAIDEVRGKAELVTLFANALHDYLATRLPESAFASFCFALITNPGTDELLANALPELRPIIWDCTDLAWLSNSTYFHEFKLRLARVLEALVAQDAISAGYTR